MQSTVAPSTRNIVKHKKRHKKIQTEQKANKKHKINNNEMFCVNGTLKGKLKIKPEKEIIIKYKCKYYLEVNKLFI